MIQNNIFFNFKNYKNNEVLKSLFSALPWLLLEP